MAIVRSAWESSATPIPMTGLLDAPHWASAHSLAIPAGFMLVQNDASAIDIGLDLVGDSGNDAGTNDYFWFVVDVDNNGAVTPSRDVLYGLFPGQPNRLGRWLMAGPNETYGAPLDQVIASQCHEGFGPSAKSGAPHRQWQLRLEFSELGIAIDPSLPPPVIHFGLRCASSTPGFVHDTPANVLSDFAAFDAIVLATAPAVIYPAGTAGAVIGGVGFIPATKIGADGYAMAIPAPYPIDPDEAAFGGTLEILANTATAASLYAGGARKYKVMHRSGNTAANVNAAAWAPLRVNWVNYRWNGATYVMDSFAPDANDMYTFVDPSVDYSIKALLCQWDTSAEPNNVHQLEMQFFAAGGAPIAAPVQTLTLRIDNQAPTVKLLNILHNGTPVAPCTILTLSSATDGVQLEFEAFDAEGDLLSWSLDAEFGAGVVSGIASDSYAAHHDPTGHHVWQGPSDATAPAAPGFVPPYTCAYLFRIGASSRVTNGYEYIGYTSDFKTVTIIKPGSPIITMLKTIEPIHAVALGFTPHANGGTQPVGVPALAKA